jgi:8-hydroxy-5-deazaflavin:NADPH oxidoreductase
MRVGILGSGVVGQALAEGFASRGHDVRAGGRAGFAAIAEHAELVVLAVKGDAALPALELAGHANLEGKVLVDATNPLVTGDGPPRMGAPLGPQVQAAVPAARVVKCFNTITAASMVDPPIPATMFLCGDDPGAKATVTELLASFGWTSIEDLGGIDRSGVLEALAEAWIIIGIRDGAWSHGLAVVR